MPRYIDADALWMDIIHNMDYCEDILEFIEAQPTADAVEVVRCKDCKWHDDDFCLYLDVMGFYDNQYCSFGQRKETEDGHTN